MSFEEYSMSCDKRLRESARASRFLGAELVGGVSVMCSCYSGAVRVGLRSLSTNECAKKSTETRLQMELQEVEGHRVMSNNAEEEKFGHQGQKQTW